MKKLFSKFTKHLAQKIANDIEEPKKSFFQLRKLAYKESAQFMDQQLSESMLFTDLHKFWSYAINQIPEKGILFEFGVYSGGSINHFSSTIKNRKIYGFDSFEGLSEDWSGSFLPKGTFNREGIMPKVNSNVELIKGWVEDTLPSFVTNNKVQQEKIAFIHFDFDIYSPTKFAFQLLRPHLKSGTIIVFDELLGYPGWKENEYKALQEVLKKHEYQFIGFCEPTIRYEARSFIKAAIRML
jgi:predicted O-methyltransferase YrrM